MLGVRAEYTEVRLDFLRQTSMPTMPGAMMHDLQGTDSFDPLVAQEGSHGNKARIRVQVTISGIEQVAMAWCIELMIVTSILCDR